LSVAHRRGGLPCLLLALVGAMSAALAGCGQMGPLTLPATGDNEAAGTASVDGTGTATSNASGDDSDDEGGAQNGR